MSRCRSLRVENMPFGQSAARRREAPLGGSVRTGPRAVGSEVDGVLDGTSATVVTSSSYLVVAMRPAVAVHRTRERRNPLTRVRLAVRTQAALRAPPPRFLQRPYASLRSTTTTATLFCSSTIWRTPRPSLAPQRVVETSYLSRLRARRPSVGNPRHRSLYSPVTAPRSGGRCASGLHEAGAGRRSNPDVRLAVLRSATS